MLAALWAYDGWNGMPMAGGEIRNAQRDIPLALIGGMLIVMLIYLAVNFAFFVALPLREAASSYSPDFPLALPVATNAALATIGPSAVVGVSIVLAFSALVSLNGSILTGARVPFAMARDGVLFSALGRVHHKTRTPVISVLVQGVIAIVIACSGTFDQLTDYVMFASWVFYALAVLSLFVLRKRHSASTNFVAPGYPWIPLAFLAVTAWLIANTLLTAPMESLIGLGLIALGIPVFLYFRKHSTRVEVIGK
jgi:APA family basic amino acid/polyamine antiporter